MRAKILSGLFIVLFSELRIVPSAQQGLNNYLSNEWGIGVGPFQYRAQLFAFLDIWPTVS